MTPITRPTTATAAAIFQACANTLFAGIMKPPAAALSSWLGSVTTSLSLRELEGAHVAHDRPAVLHGDLRCVGRHHADAVADGRVQLAIRHLLDALLMEGR